MKNSYKYDIRKHGVTQSMIGLWMSCKEQARLKYIEGWSLATGTTPLPLHYGSTMHYLLERHTDDLINRKGNKPLIRDRVWVDEMLARFTTLYKKEQPSGRFTTAMTAQHEMVCGMVRAVFPAYTVYSQKDGGPLYRDADRVWLASETNFRVEKFAVPVVGRIDAMYKTSNEKVLGVFDSKNLSIVDEETLMDWLPCDHQMMTYLMAAQDEHPDMKSFEVTYNVMRRPMLRQKQNESLIEFFDRIAADVEERPDHYFIRFRLSMTKSEIEKWANEWLIPVLLDMSEWWEQSRIGKPFPYNPGALVTKYGRVEMFTAITRGDFSGYVKRNVPFSELQD